MWQTGPTWVVVAVFAIFNLMVFGAAVLVSKLRHSEYAETVDDARMSVRRARARNQACAQAREEIAQTCRADPARIVLLDGLASSTAQRDSDFRPAGTARSREPKRLHRKVLRALRSREYEVSGCLGWSPCTPKPTGRVRPDPDIQSTP